MRKTLITMLFGGLVTLFVTAGASAQELTNGDFSGDYGSWNLTETNPVTCSYTGCSNCFGPDWGTWGIVDGGSKVFYYGEELDHLDGQVFTQENVVLGLYFDYVTYENLGMPVGTVDNGKMALFLHNGCETHTMSQDFTLPENASIISWDMFYQQLDWTQWDPTHPNGFASNQYLRIVLVDMDNVCANEELFLTVTGEPDMEDSLLEFPLTTLQKPLPACFVETPQKNVRVVVELKTEAEWIVAGFDNFEIIIEQIVTPPDVEVPQDVSLAPGWSKKPKKGWDGPLPPGLQKRKDKMIEKGKAPLPPGLTKDKSNKGKAAAPGQQKKIK